MSKSVLNKDIEYEAYFKSLGRPEKDVEKLFSTMKDVYMLALVTGFKYKKRKPIKKPSSDPIKLSIFDDDDEIIMNIIAAYENIGNNDLSLLRSDMKDEKYKLVEEYANGGIEILVREICNKGRRLEDLKNFAEMFNPNIEKKDDTIDIIFGAGVSL